MGRLGMEEGQPIEHNLISRAIENAQKKVEAHNFDIRKHLLEYDDVMNKQREVIYSRRNRALEGENFHDEIVGMIEDFVGDSVTNYMGAGMADADWTGLAQDLAKTMRLTVPVTEEERPTMTQDVLMERIRKEAVDYYEAKCQRFGDDLMAQLERFAILKTIDDSWREHLYEMDLLKEGIGLRAYGQKDPLIEYKQEGFRTFSEMLGGIDVGILEILFKTEIRVEEPPDLMATSRRRQSVPMAAIHQEAAGMGFAGQSDQAQQAPQPGKQQPVRVTQKAGRNDPCPCGSGKKFKHCHGR
jgi:preprotein translocase subunit SecA